MHILQLHSLYFQQSYMSVEPYWKQQTLTFFKTVRLKKLDIIFLFEFGLLPLGIQYFWI